MEPKPAVDILLYPPPESQADIPFPGTARNKEQSIITTSKERKAREGMTKVRFRVVWR